MKEQIVKEQKVSIITVTYNCANSLQRTIDSVLKQGFTNIEYIFVDGCSTDGTFEVIKENWDKNPNIIKYVSEKDNGLYDAMNKGIAMASGSIIGIINGDDYYTENAIWKAVSIIAETDCDIVYSDLIYIKNGKVDYDHPLKADHRRLVERMSVNHPTCFVKKSVYDKLGTFNTQFKIAADYEIMARFFSKGCKFRKADEILAVMENGGLSHNNRQSIHEKYKIHRKYFGRGIAEFYRIRNIFLYIYRSFRRDGVQ